MPKVILICGKICSGKTHYAKQLLNASPAVLLSTDEVTYDLIENEQGEYYNIFAVRVNRYLRKKAAEIVCAGADVILDWGFWTKGGRAEISDFFREHHIPFEWHYLDTDDETWYKNIETRNRIVQSGCGGSDFYVDEGLLQKVLSLFEIPDKAEIDVWVDAKRE